MAATRFASLRQIVADPTPDADLLGRFIASRDEPAFAELVRRHGPIVYRVCRRLLGASAVDDAFQATFLVLACKARRVRKAGSVGSWLVGVAGRVARQMRKQERRAGGVSPLLLRLEDKQGADAPRSPELSDLACILDDELTRLPDHLRGPVVVCLVQGRTQDQAVAELGTSVRTIRRRLDEAKRLLRDRLERRGVVPAVAAGLVAGIDSTAIAVPADLSFRTVSLVSDFLAGGAATVPAAMLAKGVATTMIARKVTLAVVSVAIGLTALGVGLADDKPKATAPAPGVVGPALPAGPVAASRAGASAVLIAAPIAEGAATRAIANEAVYQLKALAELWLSRELPSERRPPLDVKEVVNGMTPPPPAGSLPIRYRRDGKPGSSTTLEFEKGRVERVWVEVAGPLEDVLTNQIPHEMAHVVLAEHFGKPIPRWADEGIAGLAESAAKQAEQDIRCREILNQGRGMRLRMLFTLTELPRDLIVVCAQGHSVAKFLMVRQKPSAFISFVEKGMADGWNKAAKDVYGFESVDALEDAWIESLRTSPEQVSTGASATIPPAGLPIERNRSKSKPGDALIPAANLPMK